MNLLSDELIVEKSVIDSASGERCFSDNSMNTSIADDFADGLIEPTAMPLHGGDIYSASVRYGIPAPQWLDLSTGLNPESYPLPQLDAAAFQRLPYLNPDFIAAAAHYYGNDQLMPCNGSQLIIQALPQCLEQEYLPPGVQEKLPVLLPEYGYQEHRDHWQRHGNPIRTYPAFDSGAAVATVEAAIDQGDPFHLVVINPNNPTGLCFTPQQLKNWAERMPGGGYLVVDEAFIDLEPTQSVLANHFCDNMLVLRSFGKFFGLAGIRLGFVFAQAELRNALQQHTGIWMVNGPAQSLATRALLDSEWQYSAQHRIRDCAAHTRQLFSALFDRIKPLMQVHTPLFSSYQIDRKEAYRLHHHFASQGILLRVIELDGQTSLLRIGISSAADDQQSERLREAVASYVG
ncbi:threonine-phosphate decarboxylase [Amphritea balenae]|uniref:Aminotransferase n=1 Tax=Amphritea balenae TaxID=452629 RepID=A0A3P1SU43_9GAMM|nr:threonine-phosphate decarboxylase [Amphritea balenae]RRD00734.1 pyridoxal phosphate-dependent class II aminotransferase [Amphritea balenae]GGK68225.1 threonine-phosphate decarboxylase [Amphritea balenae]